MNSRTAKKQGGFTLIEIVVAIIVIGIVAAALTPILFGAKDDTLVSTETKAMSRSVTNLVTRYNTEAWDGDIDNEEMIVGEMISESYKVIRATSTIYNQFGGEITIDGVAFNGLTWASEKIPKTVCASYIAEVKNLTIFQTVTVGSTDLQYSSTGNADYTAACDAAAGSNDSLTLVWTKEEA
tara:strand:+ start:1844 stop:2389 length:546 start_codon:yes stop_codon:yes gene_type:complete